jgi:hypothetical protein
MNEEAVWHRVVGSVSVVSGVALDTRETPDGRGVACAATRGLRHVSTGGRDGPGRIPTLGRAAFESYVAFRVHDGARLPAPCVRVLLSCPNRPTPLPGRQPPRTLLPS